MPLRGLTPGSRYLIHVGVSDDRRYDLPACDIQLRESPRLIAVGRDMDRLLTAEEITQRLGVKTQWVWAQARAGQIPHVPLGRYRRFRESAVEAWVANSRPKAHRRQRFERAARAPRGPRTSHSPSVASR